MTRLTQEQIAEAWEQHVTPRGLWLLDGYATHVQEAILAFAHRIAALAVQEVEREYKRELDKHYATHVLESDWDGRNTLCGCKDREDCDECDGLGWVRATPSPEAREVPSEVVVRVEDAYATEYSSPVVRITPADAKRIGIMGGWRDAEYERGWRDAMAQDNPPVEAE